MVSGPQYVAFFRRRDVERRDRKGRALLPGRRYPRIRTTLSLYHRVGLILLGEHFDFFRPTLLKKAGATHPSSPERSINQRLLISLSGREEGREPPARL